MAISYTIVHLGSPWGPKSLANAINNNSTVTGWLLDEDLLRAMRFKGNLEALSPKNGNSIGLGINNNAAEQIVGVVPSPYSENHAALWNNGAYVNLHTLFGYAPYIESAAIDINDNGIVVGHAGLQACRFDTSSQEFEILKISRGEPIYATAINNKGIIVGATWRYSEPITLRPFLYDGTMHQLPIPSGGSFVPLNTYIDINDSDNIVGTYHIIGSGMRAFSYSSSNSQVEDIHNDAFAESNARSINNNHVIVGQVYDSLGEKFAMIKYPSEELKKLIDLVVNPNHWKLETATAINDQGEIVGYGKYYGHSRAFLLIPITEGPNSPVKWREHLPTLVAQIIIGLLPGGDGIIWRPGSGPTPVDPEPYHQWAALSSKEQEILMGLAIQELSHRVGDDEVQEIIKKLGIKSIQWSVYDLLRRKF
jgi:uncharacterized membrane protein